MRLGLSSIAAGTLVLAGCGSGAASTGTTTGDETAVGPAIAAYIAKADALCTAENRRLTRPGTELAAVLRETQASGKLAPAAVAIREFAAEVARGLTHFEALEPPAAQRPAVEAMIATEADQQVLFGELAAALAAEDHTATQTIETRLGRNKMRYGAQTAELGFKVCGLLSR